MTKFKEAKLNKTNYKRKSLEAVAAFSFGFLWMAGMWFAPLIAELI